MNADALLEEIGVDKSKHRDLHVTRMFSAFVVVSEGKVISVTEPSMSHCPLARHFYPEYADSAAARERIRGYIARAAQEKIARFGFFTGKRELVRERIEVPYGASEMLMYALRKGVIDAAVVACDGAGTVVVDRPEVVQGIGARMNGLFFTTPIREVVERLASEGCRVVSKNGEIDQIRGLREAARMGFRSIAVTISAFMDERLSDLREVEMKTGVRAVSLMVCATGVRAERLREMEAGADLVWACGSPELRTIVGKKAILQITTKIPVYVLTVKGLSFVSAYSSNPGLIQGLDDGKQHLIAGNRRGTRLTMGSFQTYLSEAELPVRDPDEPTFSAGE